MITQRTQAPAGRGGAARTRPKPGDLVVYCPDQLGPVGAPARAAGLDEVMYPSFAGPERVDWVDYKKRLAAGRPRRVRPGRARPRPARTRSGTSARRATSRTWACARGSPTTSRPCAPRVQRTLSDDKIFEKPELQMFPPPTQELNARSRPRRTVGARSLRRLACRRARRARHDPSHRLAPNGSPSRSRPTPGLLAWDASWYRDIAHVGYDGVATEGLRFFPLFPLLGRVVSWLPGASAGFGVVLVANVVRARVGLRAVRSSSCRSATTPTSRAGAVWLVYLAPPAFVLVMGYAEATFMTFAAIALHRPARRGAGGSRRSSASSPGLTRPVGVLLVVPALVEGWQTPRRQGDRCPRSRRPPVCFAYLIWAAHRTHDFWYPLRAQQDPTRRGHWVDPVRAVAHNVHELFSGDHVSAGVHAVSAVVFVVLLVVSCGGGRSSFTLYAGVALVVALGSRNLDSLERYGLATCRSCSPAPTSLADPAASGSSCSSRWRGARRGLDARVHRRAGAVGPRAD